MDSLEVTFVLTALTGVLIYVYLVWNFNYWRKRGIDGPKPKPLYGNVPSLISQSRNVTYDLDDIYRKYKAKERFVGIFSLRSPQLLITDPKLIREILITNFRSFHDNEFANLIDSKADPILSKNPFFAKGNQWKEKRAEVTPALTTNRMKAIYGVMQDVCSQMTKYLEKVTKSQPEDGLDAKQLAGSFTSEVVSNCIFGIDTGVFVNGTSDVLEMGESIIQQSFWNILYTTLVTIVPVIKKIYSQPLIEKKHEKFFVDLMNQAIKLRLENKCERVDFLNYLLQLRDKKNLSTLDMTSHTLTFFIDGFVTSSILISNTLHMLAQHKDIQNCLRDEINSAIAADGELTFEKLSELPYLDQCLNESLRLHPPLLGNNKICVQDCEITTMKDKKVKIEKGTVIVLPYYSVQHDEEYYSDPETYNPDRFSPENGGLKKYKDMGVFLPFGDGPRICLGMKFAMYQSKAAIVELIRNWEITPNPKTKKEFVLDAKEFVGIPSGGSWLNFKRIGT